VLEVASMTRHKVLITSSLDTSTTEAADDDTTGTHTIQQDEDGGVRMEERWSTENQTTPFMFLSLDIPPTPLFKDSQGGLIIPQIPLFEVLAKFDGSTWTDGLHKSTGSLVRKQYKLKSLPRYLILHLNRFTKNNFYVEKNPTIVTFPVKNLEMRDYLQTPDTSATTAGGNKSTDCGGEVDTLLTKTTDDIDTMSVKELKEVVRRFGNKLEVKAAASAVEKKQLQDVARTCMIRRCSDNLEDSELMDECDATTLLSSKYDLMANICHDSAVSQGMTIVTDSKKPKSKAQLQQTSGHAAGKSAVNGGLNVLEGGSYRVHIQNKATSQWFELQDLHVMETMPQMIGLSESYMLIYEKKSATTNGAQSRNITT
ncbi:Usp39, partial [Symbiodinium microadriaticum]